MEKLSKLTSLAATLAEKQKQDEKQIAELTSEQLGQHARNLIELSKSDLDLIKTISDTAKKDLNEILNGKPAGIIPAMKDQQRQLQIEIEKQTKLLIWIIKIPVLALLIVCLLICAGTWVYWKWAAPWEEAPMQAGPFQVLKGDWEKCNMGTTAQPVMRPCRAVGKD